MSEAYRPGNDRPVLHTDVATSLGWQLYVLINGESNGRAFPTLFCAAAIRVRAGAGPAVHGGPTLG
jgi:hypothetical protein